MKLNSTEQRALHEEVAQLLTYSVNAAETEQATQNIAIEELKLANAPARRLRRAATPAPPKQILTSSQKLAEPWRPCRSRR